MGRDLKTSRCEDCGTPVRPRSRRCRPCEDIARVGRPGRDVEAARVDVRAWLAGMSA